MNEDLFSAGEALDAADDALVSGRQAAAHVVATGFPMLDTYLGGGLRGGELALLAGPQGLGKTAFGLQVARFAASAGAAALVFSYEHDVTTLLERLVTVEAGDTDGVEGVPLRQVRAAMEGAGPELATLERRLTGTVGGAEAVAALRAYGPRLMLHRSVGSATGIEAIRSTVATATQRSGHPPLVFVDYLQKVHQAGTATEDERIGRVVTGLKDVALEFDVPVLAVAAAGAEGLATGRRMRIAHLHPALAYEADVVLVMNEKVDAVARHHLVYDTRAADRFRDFVVLSIEKNRSGLARIDLQLRKRLEQSRFEREAEPVHEELVDDRVHPG